MFQNARVDVDGLPPNLLDVGNLVVDAGLILVGTGNLAEEIFEEVRAVVSAVLLLLLGVAELAVQIIDG